MKLLTAAAAAAVLAFSAAAPASDRADEPFIGQVITVGFTFCPRGWARADGQLLPIAQYSALFSLLGTTYGGDGRTDFALPDLRGRVPVHTGQGDGLPEVRLGQKGSAAGGRKGAVPQYLGMMACIALDGVFPSRS